MGSAQSTNGIHRGHGDFVRPDTNGHTNGDHSNSAASQLSRDYPWTTRPLIVNAPMGGFAGGRLASAVTLTGGIGLIGGVFDMKALGTELEIAMQKFQEAKKSLSTDIIERVGDATMPLGVGLLPFVSKLDEAIPVIAKYKPRIVWLFAAKEFEDYGAWKAEVQRVSHETKLWIQVGSVTAAIAVARICEPDVLVMQGSDAGGHGFERGASVISLLPEATDRLRREGFGHIPLMAAGGIVDGRGVAAALALGASGVVMGTRFLAAEETTVHPAARKAILEVKDGALGTAKSKVFDELKGPNIWPVLYDGRAVLNESWQDYHRKGEGIEKVREKHADSVKGKNVGLVGEDGHGSSGRAAIWAGAGSGLVNETMSAGAIVNEVREEARKVLEGSRLML